MEPMRHEKSKLCVRCKTGERGLLLGMISKSILHAFDGYVNNQAGTNKKIVDDVYKRGDRAFNTGMCSTARSSRTNRSRPSACAGDVMVADKYGYLYFCDRTGDTFRWKGENVSTVEVENILMDSLKRNEVVVFGVSIPGWIGTDEPLVLDATLDCSLCSIGRQSRNGGVHR